MTNPIINPMSTLTPSTDTEVEALRNNFDKTMNSVEAGLLRLSEKRAIDQYKNAQTQIRLDSANAFKKMGSDINL